MKIFETFGTDYSKIENKRNSKVLTKIIELSKVYEKMSDQELKNMTNTFKSRLNNNETIADILPEAYAVVREMSKRVLKKEPYECQVNASIALNNGDIVEMNTGEGKTLSVTMSAYLNALEGKGVHIITSNDYLAQRDKELNGPLFEALGLSVGCAISRQSYIDPKTGKTIPIKQEDDKNQLREEFKKDITYTTCSTVAFSYLKDNMAETKEEKVLRDLNYAIIDEVDSILIDDAKTPLIISKSVKTGERYNKVNKFVETLKPFVVDVNLDKVDQDKLKMAEVDYDYIVSTSEGTVQLTKKGYYERDKFFGKLEETELMTYYIQNALKANSIMKNNTDYLIQDGKIEIIDQSTGRIAKGRKFAQGLHQAIEAKEHLKISNEQVTLATINHPNFFKLYEKVSGMSGTVKTSEKEFNKSYGLGIVKIEPRLKNQRIDNKDVLVPSKKEKLDLIINKIIECHKKGQPILIGTGSVEESMELDRLLKIYRIEHNTLNASNDKEESNIIAQAGRLNAVTISTAMSGRGTDIILGGNPEELTKQELMKLNLDEEIINKCVIGTCENEQIQQKYNELFTKYKEETTKNQEQVKASGGLFVLGTVKYPSKRIDNQLRGRSGRQGDPGETKFIVSLDDDIFTQNIKESDMEKLKQKLKNNQSLAETIIDRTQSLTEERDVLIRANLNEYESVLSTERETYYEYRNNIIESKDITTKLLAFINRSIEHKVDECFKGEVTLEKIQELERFYTGDDKDNQNITDANITKEDLKQQLKEKALTIVTEGKQNDEEQFQRTTKRSLLKIGDKVWADHLEDTPEQIRQAKLNAYAGKDSKQEFKFVNHNAFKDLCDTMVDISVIGSLKYINLDTKKEIQVNESHKEK